MNASAQEIPSEWMTIVWRDFLLFAAGDEHMTEQFHAATGMKMRLAGGIDGMIDEATGYADSVVRSFAYWQR